MPIRTAEQSYALGTREGRDRINQQLRANPQYEAYLRSIGATPGDLSDPQRQQAAAWVSQNVMPLGSLEIDPAGNINSQHGFAQELKKWGPVAAAAGAIAAPYVLPLMFGSGGAAAPGIAFDALPNIASSAGMANASGLGWTLPGAASAASSGASAGGGMWNWLTKGLGYIDKASDVLGAVGAGSSAFSQGQAQNRGSKLDAQMELEQLLMARDRDLLTRQIAREQEGRASGQDAW